MRTSGTLAEMNFTAMFCKRKKQKSVALFSDKDSSSIPFHPIKRSVVKNLAARGGGMHQDE